VNRNPNVKNIPVKEDEKQDYISAALTKLSLKKE
jgi:hypothetical protein